MTKGKAFNFSVAAMLGFLVFFQMHMGNNGVALLNIVLCAITLFCALIQD